MKKLFKKTKKGFTLVELLVVIAILAVLASVSVIGYLGFVEKARVSDDNTELHQIGTLVQAQLIDGSEEVFFADADHDKSDSAHTSSTDGCTAYYVKFTYDNNTVNASKKWFSTKQTGAATLGDNDVVDAIKKMVEAEDSTLSTKITTATVADGVLTIKYQNHAATESVWTLGTASE